MKSVSVLESRERRTRRGHFSSAAPGHAQNVSVSFVETSLWHDSQRAEACQDFYLSSPREDLPSRAGISHFRTAREILATFCFRIC